MYIQPTGNICNISTMTGWSAILYQIPTVGWELGMWHLLPLRNSRVWGDSMSLRLESHYTRLSVKIFDSSLSSRHCTASNTEALCPWSIPEMCLPLVLGERSAAPRIAPGTYFFFSRIFSSYWNRRLMLSSKCQFITFKPCWRQFSSPYLIVPNKMQQTFRENLP